MHDARCCTHWAGVSGPGSAVDGCHIAAEIRTHVHVPVKSPSHLGMRIPSSFSDSQGRQTCKRSRDDPACWYGKAAHATRSPTHQWRLRVVAPGETTVSCHRHRSYSCSRRVTRSRCSGDRVVVHRRIWMTRSAACTRIESCALRRTSPWMGICRRPRRPRLPIPLIPELFFRVHVPPEVVAVSRRKKNGTLRLEVLSCRRSEFLKRVRRQVSFELRPTLRRILTMLHNSLNHKFTPRCTSPSTASQTVNPKVLFVSSSSRTPSSDPREYPSAVSHGTPLRPDQ